MTGGQEQCSACMQPFSRSAGRSCLPALCVGMPSSVLVACSTWACPSTRILVVVMAMHPPNAVACLPATHVAQGYRDWCQHVDLPERIKELGLEELRKSGEVVVRRGAAGCGLRAAVGCAGCLVVVLCRAGLRCRPVFCSVCFDHVCAALVGQRCCRPAAADARRPPTARLRTTCPASLPCPQEWEFLLEELALYFLMYSEGANLRHTAEARGRGGVGDGRQGGRVTQYALGREGKRSRKRGSTAASPRRVWQARALAKLSWLGADSLLPAPATCPAAQVLWFLFWCLRNSHERQMQITSPPPTDSRSAAYIGA